jgi:hypothetical protein
MTERQLPVYGIGVQIDPRTFADFPVLIVSNLEAETADRNEIIHSALPRALGPILNEMPHMSAIKRPESCKPIDEASSVV